jgi:hypothetical protein
MNILKFFGIASVLIGVISMAGIAAWLAVIATLTTAITAYVKNQRYQFRIGVYLAKATRPELLKDQWLDGGKRTQTKRIETVSFNAAKRRSLSRTVRGSHSGTTNRNNRLWFQMLRERRFCSHAFASREHRVVTSTDRTSTKSKSRTDRCSLGLTVALALAIIWSAWRSALIIVDQTSAVKSDLTKDIYLRRG